MNIVEIKFYQGTFTINKRYADELRAKINAIRSVIPSKKSVALPMVTYFGIQKSSYYHDLVQRDISLATLFG